MDSKIEDGNGENNPSADKNTNKPNTSFTTQPRPTHLSQAASSSLLMLLGPDGASAVQCRT